MKTIEANATITADQVLIVPLPMKLSPGEVRVVVVIEEKPPKPLRRPRLNFRTYLVELHPRNQTFRREDLYGDGR